MFRSLQTRDHHAGKSRWIISFDVRRCKRKNNYRNKYFLNFEIDLRSNFKVSIFRIFWRVRTLFFKQNSVASMTLWYLFSIFSSLQTQDYYASKSSKIISFDVRQCQRKKSYRNKYFLNFEIDLRSNVIYYKFHFFDVWETIFLSNFSCFYDFVISILNV